MSHVERRDAERRVKVVLCSSMVGLLIGLVVATFIESDHPAPPRSHPVPGETNQLKEPQDTRSGHRVRTEAHDAEHQSRGSTRLPYTAGG